MPVAAPAIGFGAHSRDTGPSFLLNYFLKQLRHLGPQFFARLLLVSRQLSDGVRFENAGEVGVLLPVAERLADTGVFFGIVGERLVVD
jgi:hypothetical protein